MRGEQDQQQCMMFVICPEEMIPAGHPIRMIKKLADRELTARTLLVRIRCRARRLGPQRDPWGSGTCEGGDGWHARLRSTLRSQPCR